jgi:hypothetical protein
MIRNNQYRGVDRDHDAFTIERPNNQILSDNRSIVSVWNKDERRRMVAYGGGDDAFIVVKTE